jgi:hypothetical protein
MMERDVRKRERNTPLTSWRRYAAVVAIVGMFLQVLVPAAQAMPSDTDDLSQDLLFVCSAISTLAGEQYPNSQKQNSQGHGGEDCPVCIVLGANHSYLVSVSFAVAPSRTVLTADLFFHVHTLDTAPPVSLHLSRGPPAV